MPKIVDHDERRNELIEAASDLIAQKGIEGLTMRELARQTGVSTGVASHYFENKRDLLMATYLAVNGRIAERIDAQMDPDRGGDPADLEACLTAMMPLDKAGLRDWRVLFSYWGVSVGDEELASEQQVRARQTRQRLIDAIRAGQAARDIRGDVDPKEEAHRLVGLMQGIATQTVFDPESWPAIRQRRLIRDAVSEIRVPKDAQKIA